MDVPSKRFRFRSFKILTLTSMLIHQDKMLTITNVSIIDGTLAPENIYFYISMVLKAVRSWNLKDLLIIRTVFSFKDPGT